MREKGQTPLPALVMLDSAEEFQIPSRDAGRQIPCRILRPQGNARPKAVFMHIHGGGWVLSSERAQDIVLQDIADTNEVLCFSVGYRLAPEHPFPAGPEDCFDAAHWLIDNAVAKLGAPLTFIGGESAGAHLALLTCLELLQSSKQEYRAHADQLGGLILHFGAYDLTLNTPSAHTFSPPSTLVLDLDLMQAYVAATVPGLSLAQLRDPSISPLFADFNGPVLRGRLPPALFTCGTSDVLLDDTVFMAAKWMAAGAGAEVLLVPGGCHGYCMFPRGTKGAQADIAMDRVRDFMAKHGRRS